MSPANGISLSNGMPPANGVHPADGMRLLCVAVVAWDLVTLIPPFPLHPHNFALNYLGLYLVLDSLPLLFLPDLAQ